MIFCPKDSWFFGLFWFFGPIDFLDQKFHQNAEFENFFLWNSEFQKFIGPKSQAAALAGAARRATVAKERAEADRAAQAERTAEAERVAEAERLAEAERAAASEQAYKQVLKLSRSLRNG